MIAIGPSYELLTSMLSTVYYNTQPAAVIHRVSEEVNNDMLLFTSSKKSRRIRCT